MGSTNIRPKGSKTCTDHPKEELQFLCSDCDEILVCAICISTTHSGHKIAAISLKVQEKFSNLQDLNTNARDIGIPRVQNNLITTNDTVIELKQDIQVHIQSVKDRGEYLKELIDVDTYKTVSELENISEQIDNEFHKFKIESEKALKSLEDLMYVAEQTTKSKNNILLIDVEKELSSLTIEEPNFQTYISKVPAFQPGSDADMHIKTALGFLTYEAVSALSSKSQQNNPSSTDLFNPIHGDTRKELSTQELPTKRGFRYGTSYSELAHLTFVPCSVEVSKDGTLLIIGKGTLTLQKINENRVSSFSKLSTYLSDISIHPKTDQLYGIPQKYNSVSKVNTTTGKVTKMFTAKNSNCLTISPDGDVFVGSCGKPKVTLYSLAGIPQQKFKCDLGVDDGYWIKDFALCRISKRVALTCRNKYDTCKIVIVDGKLSKQEDIKYHGYGVVFDNEGNLLALDYKLINVYNSNYGSGVLKTMRFEKLPECLTLLDDDDLVVGTDESVLRLTYLD